MIAKIYRRIAVNVAAVHIDEENATEVVEWLNDSGFKAEVLWDRKKVFWQSRDKNMTVRFGDWIIRSGDEGLFHPCKNGYFQTTFEDYHKEGSEVHVDV